MWEKLYDENGEEEEDEECFPSFALSRSVLLSRFFAQTKEGTTRTRKEKNDGKWRHLSAREHAYARKGTQWAVVEMLFFTHLLLLLLFLFAFRVMQAADAASSLLFVQHARSMNDAQRSCTYIRARSSFSSSPLFSSS